MSKPLAKIYIYVEKKIVCEIITLYAFVCAYKC